MPAMSRLERCRLVDPDREGCLHPDGSRAGDDGCRVASGKRYEKSAPREPD